MSVRNEGTRRGRFTAQQRAELIAAFQKRKETAAEFARRHELSVPTLYQWIRRAGLGQRPAPVRSMKFREMPVGSVLGSAWSGEVELPDGTQLRWNHQAELNSLQVLLGQLRRPC